MLKQLEKYLKDLIVELGLESRVILAGYRKDVIELLHAVDCFVFPSYQEGLPVALMEAMAAGLPVVCSKIRGNVDLIIEGEGGYFIDPDDYFALAEKVNMLLSTPNKVKEMGILNMRESRKYDIHNINSMMAEIYKKVNSDRV